MMQDFSIRYGRAEDASLLSELGARTFHETFAADNRPEDMAAYISSAYNPAQQAAELAAPASRFLLVERGGEAIAYARLEQGIDPSGVADPTMMHLDRIYVRQDCTGQGVGAALMQACLEEARQQQCTHIWLGVWEHNARALAFYRKWGFEQVGSEPFLLGSDLQTDLLMQRAL